MRGAVALALALWVPLPVQAQGADAWQGRWQGEGEMVLADEPSQRLRCQLRLTPAGQADTLFSGRCATAQGAQHFHYRLSEPRDGVVLAQNLSDPPDALPPRMEGTRDALGLRFQAEGGAAFELVRDGAALRFVIAGHDRRGPARGEVLMTLRE